MNTTQPTPQTTVPIDIATSSASSLHAGAHVTPVYLNLYDLGGCANACIHSLGLSFYHCAVQTHSAEYGYMGHPYRFTGLYKTSKHDSRFHLYRLRDSIEIGWTWFSENEIDHIIDDLQPFYFGCDYHSLKKNSIHFAKYLLEQLSNDLQLKHLEPIKIIQLPSYIDRSRRLISTFDFLQMFDTEKDIAEINILYFLYMKYEGDMKQICQILKCDTLNKLKRSIQLIEQGIQQKKLPIFAAFTTFDMQTASEYLYLIDQTNSDKSMKNEQLTLTDVFHQFDTITLRGRTSIDRYLNIQRTKESTQQSSIAMTNVFVDRKSIPFDYQQRSSLVRHMETSHGADRGREENNQLEQYSGRTKYRSSAMTNYAGEHNHRSSLSQATSHNQDRTPLTSRSASNISGLVIASREPSTYSHPYSSTPVLTDPFLQYEHLHMRTAVPIGTVLRLQETPNPNLPLTELHLSTNDDPKSFSLVTHRQRKHSYTSRPRKLPHDLELTNDLYTITHPNSLHFNYTNNATTPSLSQCSQSLVETISFHTIEINEEIDSTV